tara:strand:+ start:611 stop:787 length:177 start_codon:yes stop_codon:yes gene_type:complete
MSNKKEWDRSSREEFSDVQRRMTEKTHGSKKYNRKKDGFKKYKGGDYKSWGEGGSAID